jgi:hypothetical protein
VPAFVPGLELAGDFYREAVRPVLRAEFPRLPYSAALIGPGSEVLGFDTPMSMDHDWGPRLLLFLREADRDHAAAVHAVLSRRLPRQFRGFPTAMALSPPDRGAGGVGAHAVRVTTLEAFVLDTLGFDLGDPLAAPDWLTFPSQKLRSLTAGAVYHDEVGLGAVRRRFAWYPRDVWFYLMAAGWTRIGQEQHLAGRAGSVGDELGAALIAARLVRDVMRLAFLIEREYAPYPKWFGTAFGRLGCAPALLPSLVGAQRAPTWQEREPLLCAACEQAAAMHQALAITPPVAASVGPFYHRPFRVLHGDFAGALRAGIEDPAVRAIANRRLIGGVDLISDNTDLLEDPGWRPGLRRLYSAAPEEGTRLPRGAESSGPGGTGSTATTGERHAHGPDAAKRGRLRRSRRDG